MDLRGSYFALKRILRCHPWAEPMVDPVPSSSKKTPPQELKVESMTPENRNLIMAVALSMIVLLGWQIIVIQPELEREAAQQEQIAAEMAKSDTKKPGAGQPTVDAATGVPLWAKVWRLQRLLKPPSGL